MTERIRLEPLPGGRARVRHVDRLIGDRWATFLDACRAGGARLDAVLRQQVVPTPARVADVVKALEAARFVVEVHPDVVGAIEGARSEAVVEAAAAAARIDAVLTCKVHGREYHEGCDTCHKLFDFQVEGAKWLATRTSAILGDEMGLGKTAQVVVSWPSNAPIMVLCPKIAIATWVRHVGWRDDYRAAVLSRRDRWRRVGFWPDPGQVHILNFEIMPPLDVDMVEEPQLYAEVQAFLETMPKGMIVAVDEAHLAKNLATARGGRTLVLLRETRKRGGRTPISTGTPLKNHPPDLYAMIRLAGLEDETWRTMDAFLSDFGSADEWHEDSVSRNVPEILQRVMLRREKDQVLADLPEKTWEHVTVEIPEDARKVADSVVAQLTALGIDLEEKIDLAQLTKRLGAIPFDMLSAARSALAAAKIPALREYVAALEAEQELATDVDSTYPTPGLRGDERLRELRRRAPASANATAALATELLRRGEVDEAKKFGAAWKAPFLVWSCHRAPIDDLATREGWATLTGSVTDPDKRRALEADFQAGRFRAMALTQQAGGVAITLTRAHHSIHVDLPWTPSDQSQAEDRIHRIGQKNACRYTYLIADHPLDKWLVRLLGHKAGIERAAVGAASVKSAPVHLGPPALPVGTTTSVAQDSRRCARANEGDVEAWLNTNRSTTATILRKALEKHGGLTDNQWAAATAKARQATLFGAASLDATSLTDLLGMGDPS